MKLLLGGQDHQVPGVIRAITSLAMLMTQFITKLASFVTMLALVATFVPSAVLAEGVEIEVESGDTITAVEIEDSEDNTIVSEIISDTTLTVSEDETGEMNSSELDLTLDVEPTTATVSDEGELTNALNTESIETITLAESFSINATVEVDRAVTINGNSNTITAASSVTGSAVLITGSGPVRINDLVVNGGGNYIQGIQAYVASDVELDSVTSMNNGKSGIMVNGSTVSVSDVTTSSNAWHGINVDKGSGVTSAAVLTVKGISTHSETTGPDIFIDTDADGSVTGATEQYALVKPTSDSSAYFLNSATVSNEAELTAALADQYVATITLDDSFPVSSTVAVNRSVTIDGNDETITAGGAINHVVLITASDVLIKDLTVDGSGNMVHGIQAYTVTGITLDGVTSVNNGKSGLLVNGSTVTVTDLTTSGNGWNGVNVDQGSGVITPATLTVNGVSTHDEADAIWIDDITDVNVSVVDTGSQYVSSDRAYVNSVSGLSFTGRVYVLAPEEVESSNRSGGSRRSTTTTNTGTVDAGAAGEGQVLGASTYNFTTNLTIGSTGADVNALQEMLIASGHLAIAAPTGYFGEMTKAALAKWQAANGVPATGFFGPLTIAAIAAAPAPTMSAEARAALIKDLLAKVKELQEKLDAMN